MERRTLPIFNVCLASVISRSTRLLSEEMPPSTTVLLAELTGLRFKGNRTVVRERVGFTAHTGASHIILCYVWCTLHPVPF